MILFNKKKDEIISEWKKKKDSHNDSPLLEAYGSKLVRIDYDNYYFYVSKSSNYNEKRPTIFVLHGGKFEDGNVNPLNRITLYFSSMGFTVINIEYPQACEGDYKDMYQSVVKAINFALKDADSNLIDTNNLFLFGSSAGGQIALFIDALSNCKELQQEFDCDLSSINFNAIALNHPVAYLEHKSMKDNKLEYSCLMECLFNDKETRKKISDPSYYSQKCKFNYSPMRIITSIGDTQYHENTLMLSTYLINNDAKVEVDDKSDATLGHIYNILDTDSLNSLTTNNSILFFFRKYIKN